MAPGAETGYTPIGVSEDEGDTYVKVVSGSIELHALGSTEYGAVSQAQVEEEKSNEMYGYGIMLLSAIFFEIMGVITRAVTVHHGMYVIAGFSTRRGD